MDATTIFAQAGYEVKDALNLEEQAIMQKNVSHSLKSLTKFKMILTVVK